MPRSECFPGSIKLTILEAGRVEYHYFSPDEIANYKWEGKKWPRVDTSRVDVQDEPEDALRDIVKTVAKKIFLDQKEAHLQKEQEDLFSQDIFGDSSKNNQFENLQPLSDIEELEKKLSEYIESENYEKAAEIRDKIRKQRGSDA